MQKCDCLFVCLFFFFTLLALDNVRFIPFLTPIFLFISITCHVYLPRAHAALPFQTCMPRALAFRAHHIRLLRELVTINGV